MGTSPKRRFSAAVLFLMLPAALSSRETGPDFKAVEAAAVRFEKTRGECAAVLVESQRCRIVFIHNRGASVERRFPPGSLMKPMSAAILIDSDPSFPAVTVQCRGHFVPDDGFALTDEKRFNLAHDPASGRRSFSCSLTTGHGNVMMRDALIRSCNVFFLSSAQKSPQLFERLVSVWKLDDPLLPGLSAHSSPPKEISEFQKISASIGEGTGVLLSPLKVAENYSALFEGTPLMEPHESGEPSVRSELLLKGESLDSVRSALTGTVTGGTLAGLKVPAGFRVLGGKTGTSTALGDKSIHHGWNAVWFEHGGTRYVLVTFVLKGRGAKEACALSSEILGAM